MSGYELETAKRPLRIAPHKAVRRNDEAKSVQSITPFAT